MKTVPPSIHVPSSIVLYCPSDRVVGGLRSVCDLLELACLRRVVNFSISATLLLSVRKIFQTKGSAPLASTY